VRDDKLDALIAELRAMDLWDRPRAEAPQEDDIDRSGFEARQMRRLEIIGEINALLAKEIEILKNVAAAGRFVFGKAKPSIFEG
jgi:hypothetical protein